MALAAVVDGRPDNQLSLHPAFVIRVIAAALNYTWLYNNTKSNLLLAVLFHTALDAPLSLVPLPQGSPEDLAGPFCLISALWVLAAIIVAAVFGPSQLSLHRNRQIRA